MEKGSYVATLAGVRVDPKAGEIWVNYIVQAFECGKITTPSNLRQQVLGGIIQALGPALRESSEFQDGAITNASFWKYQVPRFANVPNIDLHLIDRPDLPSVGAGETPLICVAPAIANAVFNATTKHFLLRVGGQEGVRLRDLPLKLPATA
jgi:isoquinoline 1-oxidoreductase